MHRILLKFHFRLTEHAYMCHHMSLTTDSNMWYEHACYQPLELGSNVKKYS